jgi:HlyD family secretion protein
MKKKLIILLLLGLVIGSGVYYKNNTDGAAPNDTLTLYGNIDVRDVALGFRVAGRIAKMRFEEGDTVKTGEVLAVLDNKPYLDNLALAKAEHAESVALETNAQRVFKRNAGLINTGSVSQRLYDEALANRDAARARKARTAAQVTQAETQLADTKIHSPADGKILTRVREPGAIVAVGATVYTLALNNPVWVRTYIDEPHLGHIYEGQPVTVITDSGGKYQGKIGFISPQAEFTPKSVETAQMRTDLVYRLRVIVDKPDNGLRQGMPVSVSVSVKNILNNSGSIGGGDEK